MRNSIQPKLAWFVTAMMAEQCCTTAVGCYTTKNKWDALYNASFIGSSYKYKFQEKVARRQLLIWQNLLRYLQEENPSSSCFDIITITCFTTIPIIAQYVTINQQLYCWLIVTSGLLIWLPINHTGNKLHKKLHRIPLYLIEEVC